MQFATQQPATCELAKKISGAALDMTEEATSNAQLMAAKGFPDSKGLSKWQTNSKLMPMPIVIDGHFRVLWLGEIVLSFLLPHIPD
jgi:hypothetical protein